MGIVYLAKDPVIGRLVALKTIRTGGSTDDEEAREFQARFVREAQAAGILNHPSIVTVHDIGQDETGTSFIAMEYVEGHNLKDVLTQGRPLSFDDMADIIAQVAEALDFAHAKGIVHRDVKPANIILLDNNKAKITDFGIAKIASGAQNLTTTGQFLGTPNYMAPEQIKGAPVDGRSDIFSLGICLYECLTRRKPFGGDSLTSISYKIVHEAFPPLQGVNPQIPAAFEEVVTHCLAKDPSKRYQRAGEMAVALRAVTRGEKPAGPAERIFPDETMITREEKAPTLEVPFPHAASEGTRPGIVSAAGPAAAASQTGRGILPDVRSSNAMRTKIPAAAFFGVIALLIAGLLGSVVTLRGKKLEEPVIDTVTEAKREKERRVREEANALLKQGRVADAYSKYEELQRIAPQSPFVLTVLQRLSAIREQEEIGRQQVADADKKFQEGLLYFNQGAYGEAIDLFQEAFSLNPTSLQAAEYLRLAQIEELKVRLARGEAEMAQQASTGSVTATGGPDVAPSSTPTGGAVGRPGSTQPSQMTTSFNHNFTDGRLVVRVGGDIVANENLYGEKGGGLFRKTTRAPRPISVTKTFPAKSSDVQVWVMVPAQGIQEHRVLPARRFDGGAAYRLTVRYDEGSKKFTYELN